MVGSSNKFVLHDDGMFLSTVYDSERDVPGTFKPGGYYIIGKLHSIFLLALVLVLSQSLRKVERRFSEDKR